MRRALKWLGWTAAALVGLLALLVVAVVAGANTDPGRRLIERELAAVTGDTVRISGLAGFFPTTLRADRVEIRDAIGAYVTIDHVMLDFSPLALLHGEAQIDRVTADSVDVPRLPISKPASNSGSGGGGGGFTLPVRVSIGDLHVSRLTVGAAVAGQPATLVADGSGTVAGSLQQGHVVLHLRALDGEGQYALDGTLDPAGIEAALTAHEPAHGLLSRLAGVPDLGAVALDAQLHGPHDAVATKLALTAGPLRADADGTVDLVHNAADLTVTANAPAMTPRPDVSWQSVDVDARIHGPFARPDASGRVRIEQLAAAGAAVAHLAADVRGNAGQVELHASADGVRVPGPRPDLLAAAPLKLDATAHLDAADRPVRFTLSHPLIDAEGTAQTAGALQGTVSLKLPDLAPFAAAGGTDLQGRLALTLRGAVQGEVTALDADGTVGVTGGAAPVPALLGEDAHLVAAATLRGQDVTLSRLELNGKTLSASANGRVAPAIDLTWTARLANLAAVQPTLTGTLQAVGHVSGTQDDLALVSDIAGDIGSGRIKPGHVTAHVDAQHLPGAPAARVTAQGTLLDSPIDVAVAAEQANGALHVAIDRAEWKSAHAEGNLTLKLAAAATQGTIPPGADTGQPGTTPPAPPATPAGSKAPLVPIPQGKLQLRMTRLADLAPLIGKDLSGSVTATLDSNANQARLALDVRDASLPGTASISRAALAATIAEPTTRPVVDGTLALDGVSAGSVHGAVARLAAKGPQDALGLKLTATLPGFQGSDARVAAGGTLDVPGKALALASLQADWKQLPVRLLAPVRIGFADGVSLDRLRLGLRQGVLEVAGRAGEKLDLTATLRNLPVDIAAIAAPSLAADGTVNAEARLTGTSAQPIGTVRVTANGMRLRTGPGRGLPAANLTATADLRGTEARLDTRVTAGPSHLAVTGTAPLGGTGALNLRANGLVDLAMADPILAAEGRRARGQVTLDSAIGGTIAAPRVTGSARLANGDVQDVTLGVHITAITALIEAQGDTIRIAQFTGRAGPGTVGASGTVGLGTGVPVNLTVTANDARPIATDIFTALIDANLFARGEATGQLTAGGTLHVRRADIQVPDKLPPSVAVLPVRIPGQPPPPPPAPPPDIALDLTLDAPEQIFIRGRGLDAELGGKVHLGGTAARPVPSGGFQLRHGIFSIAGQTLTFTEGTIDFAGGGIENPSLLLIATSSTSTTVAKLTVSGSARDPKITLSSTPELPQDEVLAQLLFHRSANDLGPFELAQIGAALAELSGATGNLDPLGKIRGALGLDRLTVGTGTTGNSTLEAGRYVRPGVYVGARQATSGTGTQGVVQVDIAKGLQFEATAGSGTNTATGANGSEDGASVGLRYRFEY
jgi:translocation and assembly module TamB